MEPDEIIEAMRWMGIEERSPSVLALLPLVQVAWADARLRPEEERLVLLEADTLHSLDAHDRHLLEGWLRHRPSEAFFGYGRRLLVVLANMGHPLFVPEDDAETVAEVARRVARGARTRLSMGVIGPHEQRVLDELVQDLGPVAMPIATRVFHPPPRDPALAARQAHLLQYTRNDVVFHPVDGDGLTVGRGRDNDIQIALDPQVSRVHFRVSRAGETWRIEDQGGPIGTVVNGERAGVRRLLGGEVIQAGNQAFRFALPGSVAESLGR